MKRFGIFQLVLMIMLTLIIACSKDNTDLPLVQKKPYAWVVGDKDSTDYGMILFFMYDSFLCR